MRFITQTTLPRHSIVLFARLEVRDIDLDRRTGKWLRARTGRERRNEGSHGGNPVRAPGTAVAAIRVRRLDVLTGSLIAFAGAFALGWWLEKTFCYGREGRIGVSGPRCARPDRFSRATAPDNPQDFIRSARHF